MFRAPPLPAARCCLFLDIDGTLLDIAPTPNQVVVDPALRELLSHLDHSCQGAVAFVSGRSLEDIDNLFEPLCLAAAGIHGFERRDAQGHCLRPSIDPGELETLRLRLGSALRPLDGVIIEDKHFGLALHFRLAPQLEQPLRDILTRLAPLIPPRFEQLDGDHVIEIKPRSHNKATAIEAFMQEAPFSGRQPVFIGDDLTDRDGFTAVRRHDGLAIGVGPDTDTEWQLENFIAVRGWLESFLLRDHVT